MVFEIEPTLANRFPGLRVVVGYVDGVRVENSGAELQRFKEEVRRLHTMTRYEHRLSGTS